MLYHTKARIFDGTTQNQKKKERKIFGIQVVSLALQGERRFTRNPIIFSINYLCFLCFAIAHC